LVETCGFRGFQLINFLELSTKAELPPLGADKTAEQWKQRSIDAAFQNSFDLLTSLLAASAATITLTSVIPGKPLETDYMSVEASVGTIGSNIAGLAHDIRLLASLSSVTQGEGLLHCSRSLCASLLLLLQVAFRATHVFVLYI
jgi:hypothetical protein